MSDKSMNDALARIDELEVRLTFQEDLIQELNQVIARQDQQLLRLQEQVKMLADKHKDLAFRVSEQGDTTDERPPHY